MGSPWEGNLKLGGHRSTSIGASRAQISNCRNWTYQNGDKVCVEREREKKREKRRRSRSQNLSKSNSKMKPKSIKNQPRRYRKSTEKSKKSIKNQSWRGLGGVLRRLGGQDRKRARGISFLGPSWSHLGGLLGRLGGVLGPSWRSWRPLGPVLGSSWGPKSDSKSTKYRPKNRSELWCLWGSTFWRILVDFTSQDGAKMLPKTKWKSMSMSKGYFSKTVIFPKEKRWFW